MCGFTTTTLILGEFGEQGEATLAITKMYENASQRCLSRQYNKSCMIF
jgi:hypothetical protein